MTGKLLRTLTEARALLAAGWIKGHYAETSEGVPIQPSAPSACRFCIVGAIAKVVDADPSGILRRDDEKIIEHLEKQLAGDEKWIADFNDAEKTTREDVLALFDRAIEAAR